jgi:hypothetical protein
VSVLVTCQYWSRVSIALVTPFQPFKKFSYKILL